MSNRMQPRASMVGRNESGPNAATARLPTVVSSATRNAAFNKRSPDGFNRPDSFASPPAEGEEGWGEEGRLAFGCTGVSTMVWPSPPPPPPSFLPGGGGGGPAPQNEPPPAKLAPPPLNTPPVDPQAQTPLTPP